MPPPLPVSEPKAEAETTGETAATARPIRTEPPIVIPPELKQEHARASALIELIKPDSSRQAIVLITEDPLLGGAFGEALQASHQDDSETALIRLKPGDQNAAGWFNPFDHKMETDDHLQQELAIADAVDNQTYVMEAALGRSFVQHHRATLRHLFRLLTVIPDSDLATFQDLLCEDKRDRFCAHVDLISTRSTREFFNDFVETRMFRRFATAAAHKLESLLEDESFAQATIGDTSTATVQTLGEPGTLTFFDLSGLSGTGPVTNTIFRIALVRSLALLSARQAGVERDVPDLIVVDGSGAMVTEGTIELDRLAGSAKKAGVKLIIAPSR